MRAQMEWKVPAVMSLAAEGPRVSAMRSYDNPTRAQHQQQHV